MFLFSITRKVAEAVKRLVAAPKKILESTRDAAQDAADMAVNAVKEGIVDQAPGGQRFAPLHPFTLLQRSRSGGGRLRLIHKGDLVRAIEAKWYGTGLAFKVGVFSQEAVGPKLTMEGLARLQQNGCSIRVTPKMRAYLHYNGLHLKAETTHIIIPPSPFIAPTIRKIWPKILERYKDGVVEGVKRI